MKQALALIPLLAALAAAGQAPSRPPAQGDAAATELARIHATLERIADALVQQTKLDILARRIQLAGTVLADTEKRLAALDGERAAIETERQRMDTARENLREAIAQGADPTPPRELEARLRQVESEHERASARVKELAGQLGELENRLSRQRADLDAWQAYLDRLVAAL
jgi:chromosome segregation ATPase